MTRPVDADARDHALDPTRSFIVQAPAGSGKTELLTRRVLTLLTTVERPEDVYAITFTRKAAAEMRQRVIAALKRAADPTPPRDDHEATGIALAKRVLERDRQFGWHLLDDPERLGMRTIDSLCTQLAQRLPVMSTLGAATDVEDDARELYVLAAERFLEEQLEQIAGVSQQLGNELEKLRDRLADLLAVREQWIAYAAEDFDDERLRDALEAMLAQLLRGRLQSLVHSLPPGFTTSLPPLMTRAAAYLDSLVAAEGLALSEAQLRIQTVARYILANGQLPDHDVSDMALWRGIADFLLTQGDTWLKAPALRSGVPAASKSKVLGVQSAELKAFKCEVVALLDALADETSFRDKLADVRKLPEPRYSDAEWALLGELGAGLPHLLAHLNVVFAERHQLDFTEIGRRALLALGDEDEPTDLALAMDYRIKHLLIDEFQDTSHAQFALFERLVAGWEPTDGRSFFAVGDPMQSIYRFRQADVGLFLRALTHGIGPVTLEPLRLSVNFRSVPPVIDWINARFSQAFPATPDADSGAVNYEASAAHLDGEGEVRVHLLSPTGNAEDNKRAEAVRVADLVQATLERDSTSDIGVLLRARSHAAEITKALQSRGIAFKAVELEPLGDRAVVRDLVALALALRYPNDRISWLSLLRGPLCGLTLMDLHTLCSGSEKARVITLLQTPERIDALSDDGRARVARFLHDILPAMDRAPRSAVTPWVETLWLRLGGPAICDEAVDLDAAERAIARLGELELSTGLWQRQKIIDAMARLYAAGGGDDDDARVQLMTLHKSKGLEFDTVIVPATDRKSGQDEPRLFDWYESRAEGRESLLLAPIDATGTRPEQRSRIGKLLRRSRKLADDAEKVRLLYVACTRAKRSLHLLATPNPDDVGNPKAPQPNSLLASLWPALLDSERVYSTSATSTVARDGNTISDELLRAPTPAPAATAAVESDVAPAPESASAPAPAPAPAPAFERVVSDWAFPTLDVYTWRRSPPAKTETARVVYDWQGTTARVVGTLVHRSLQHLAALPENERRMPDDADKSRIRRELTTLGVTASLLDDATERVVTAIRNTLDDEQGRWILKPHRDARNEWALTLPTLDAGRLVDTQRVIIDRTFIDADGTRWVIDYKTGSHDGGGLDAFLDKEVQRYREQVESYARVMRRMEPGRVVRVGLWFPMVRGWREVAPAGDAGGVTVV